MPEEVDFNPKTVIFGPIFETALEFLGPKMHFWHTVRRKLAYVKFD